MATDAITMNSLQSLPLEVLEIIVSKLDFISICSISKVTRFDKYLNNHNLLFCRLVRTFSKLPFQPAKINAQMKFHQIFSLNYGKKWDVHIILKYIPLILYRYFQTFKYTIQRFI